MRNLKPLNEPPEATLGRVEARIAGRKAAQEIIGLLSWPDGHGADYADSFLTAMRDTLPQRRKDTVQAERPEPIARLGAHRLEFGEFNGRTLDDVPESRLDWYIRKMEEDLKVFKAYRNHAEFESRRRGLD